MLKAGIEKIIENHKRFARLWKRLRDSGLDLKAAKQQEVKDVRQVLRNIDGNFADDYIAKILIAYNYAIGHSHNFTEISMYEDIIAGKRIYLSSYTKTEE